MSIAKAERDANKLLDQSWWVNDDRDIPIPVDPVWIANALGIKVRYAVLPTDESGRIVIPDEEQVVITLNATDHPNRQRFTCAHEVGHYVRRRDNGRVGTKTFVDHRNTLAGAGVNAAEIYANQFAAALLMPAHIVASLYQDDDLAPESIARVLGTSTQALQIRLRNLRMA